MASMSRHPLFRTFTSLAFVVAAAIVNGESAAVLAQNGRSAPILKHKGFVDIVRLNNLNSPFIESNPYVSPDGKYLFFLSERGGQPWSQKKNLPNYDGYDGDIWYSERSGDTWKQAEPLDAGVNSNRGDDEPYITLDARTVLFQSWRDGWIDNGGPYYESTFQGVSWGKPSGLGSGIHDFFYAMRYKDSLYATDGSTFSADLTTFVVACGPRYDGDMDLFFSSKNPATGKWAYLKKIILPVDGNERSAFLAADDKTLYFASDGFDGLGGLDIYKATLKQDGTVTNIINIGEPFNTKGDDYGFSLTATGDEAYFIRNGDLFYARLDKSMDAVKPTPIALLTGEVKNKETGAALEATIELRELPKGATMKMVSNNLTGTYAAVLTIGKSYEQTVAAPNVLPFKRTFKVASPKKGGSVKIEYDILLSPPRKTW
jgi:WD40-like Beta Propeller Repeat